MSKKQDISSHGNEQREARKGLLKREQKTFDRLREAQQAQAKAQARLERAQARLQKRSASLARIEARLRLIRQQLASQEQPLSVVQAIPESAQELSRPAANDARAAAEATEESIRTAAERAAAIAPPSENTPNLAGSPDAPIQEQAQIVERESVSPGQDQADEGPSEIVLLLEEQEQPSIMIPSEIMQIEEEEALVEASTAETLAHIAAERATKTRVAAELSSAQTREARLYAQQVEQALGRVRLDIRYGLLSGEDAEIALRQAEHEATHAQAALADAEATEEQTLQAAIDAEAAAEVAEGMAYATNDHVELLEEAEDDLEITIKIPIVRPPSEESPA